MTPEEHEMLVKLIEGQDALGIGIVVVMALMFLFWALS